MQKLIPGTMVAVYATHEKVKAILPKSLDIALVNAPELIVVSGVDCAMDAFLQVLVANRIQYIRLQTSHAFHSRMQDDILEPFSKLVRLTQRQAPSIPMMSNLTGTWLTAVEACSVDYWVNQLRYSVLFSEGIKTLQQELNPIFLEIGPSRVLMNLVYQHGIRDAYASLPGINDEVTAVQQLQRTLVNIWQMGIDIKPPIQGQVIPLPTYAWVKERCFVEPDRAEMTDQTVPKLDPLDLHTIEEQMRDLWQSVLGRHPEQTDNFFQLGGTSLSAIALMDKLSALIKVDLSIVYLYEHPQFSAFVVFIKTKLAQQSLFTTKVNFESTEEDIFSQHTEL